MKKGLIALFLTAITAFSQTVGVNDPISSFTQVLQPNGTPLTDFLADQQTGQGQDDFSVNGFFINYGTLSTNEFAQIIRIRLNEFDAKSGFTGNLRIGIDANLDGSVDLFYGIKGFGTAANRGIVFQNPTNTGSTFNVSPSTTSLGNPYGTIALTTTNYSYVSVNDGSTDAYLTFAIPFASLQNVLATAGYQVTEASFVRFIAFTSTQDNSINQDLYGTQGITNTLRFDQNGGFTDIRNFYNAPVPEPSTYGAVLMGLLILGFIAKKKSNRLL